MASFNSPINLPVSQYVSPIDPETYGKVIMQKQQQYDLGVEKINTAMSTVAGLPVIKEEHKQYLNNLVQGMQTNLQKIAGSDFSKQNNVNQALSLATNIAKDPIVQNAVISTNNYKKALEERETLAKQGKTNIKNDLAFDNEVNSWLKDKDLNSTFRGSYTPYYDVLGGFTEFLKNIKPESTLTQSDFVVDGTNIRLTRESAKEGISPEQINQAWTMFSNKGEVQSQLRIDADYEYQSIPRNVLESQLDYTKERTISESNSLIEDLKAKQAVNKTTDPVVFTQQIEAVRKQAQKQIDDLDAAKNLSDSALKLRIYQDTFKNNLISTFTYSKTSEKIVESPYEKARQSQLDYELKLMKFNEDKVAKSRGNLPETQITQTKNLAEEGKLGEASFKQKLESTKENLANTTKQYLNPIVMAAGKPAPWVLGEDGNWIPNVGPMGYSTAEEAQAASDKFYEEAKDAYSNGVAKDNVKTLFAKIDGDQRTVKAMEDASARIESYYGPDVSKVAKEIGSFNVPILGKESKVTPFNETDLINFWLVDNKVGETTIPLKELQDKFGENAIEIINTQIKGKYDPETKVRSSKYEDWYKKVSKTLSQNPEFLDAVKQKSKDYKNAQQAYISYEETFLTPKSEDYKSLETRYTKILSSIAEGAQDNRGTYKDALELITDNSKNRSINFGYSIDKITGEPYLTVQKQGETETLRLPISNTQAQLIPGINLQDKFQSTYGADLFVTRGMTTDITGQGLNPYQVVGNKNYDVKYHLLGPGNGDFMLKLYIWDKNGNKLIDGNPYSLSPDGGYMSPDQILAAVEGLGNDAVIQSIVGNKTQEQ